MLSTFSIEFHVCSRRAQEACLNSCLLHGPYMLDIICQEQCFWLATYMCHIYAQELCFGKPVLVLAYSPETAAVQGNAEVVRAAMKSPQASVRQCAMRVFKLLGGDTLPETAQTAAGSAAGAAAVPDLMTDFLGEADTPAAAPASQDFLGIVLGHQQAF